jgi:hypothetical protein
MILCTIPLALRVFSTAASGARLVLTFLLVLGMSSPTFAVCDQEKRERDEFRNNFDTASRVAGAACAAGGLAAIITFGASLIPCAPAVATAENQKRIFNEKEVNLQRCEVNYATAQREATERAIARNAKIRAIEVEFLDRREKLIRTFEERNKQISLETEAQGYDLTNADVQTEIREKSANLQQELNKALEALEAERKKAMDGVPPS